MSTLIYIINSNPTKTDQDWSMLDKMMFDVIEGIGKGYMNTYVYDCQSPVAKTSGGIMNMHNLCAKDTWAPVFQINKHADLRVNPYTGQLMNPEMIPFNGSRIDMP